MSSFHPFDADVSAIGHYVYTGEDSPLSSKLANKAQSRLIHEALKSIGPVRTLVDIGCGDGAYTNEFAKYDIKQILGIDLSEGGISSAKKNFQSNNLSFRCLPVQQLVSEKQMFDVAIIRGVIHHAESPSELIVDILKIANCIILSDPNGLNPLLKIIEKVSPYHRKHSERSFTPWKIRKWLASESNYSAQKIRIGVIVPFFCPAPVARILNLIQPIVESIPVLRWVFCGTQVHVITKSS
jgi:2-polyprenyl-3-methyl-5-hydroxy-6-metoxy-1,4-benzoquinol methylase